MGFFFPLDHRGYEVPCPPPHIAVQQYCGVQIMYRCDHRPNFFSFFPFLYSFLIFSFCYYLLILLSFLNFFLFIYSYSSLLIGNYSSYSSRTILRLPIFLFLYFNLFVVLQTYKLCTGATICPNFFVLSFFIVFF
jgi:hypothetical protein